MSIIDHLRQPHTVTFDCWCTLIVDVDPDAARAARVRTLSEAVDADAGEPRVHEALRRSWWRHQMLWHKRQVFDTEDMARLALAELGVALEPTRFEKLVEALASEALNHPVRALDGAAETLHRLAERGVRLALVCDTGFSPGRIVRQLLHRVGLLEPFEVAVFSDEVGVPKPHPSAFGAALSGLTVAADGAVHVGDLRRSDVAGAHSVGMRAVRLIAHHDDAAPRPERSAGIIDCGVAGCAPACPRPEADAIATSHAHLLEVLGYS